MEIAAAKHIGSAVAAGLGLAIEHRSLDGLIFYVRNVRTHSEAQVAMIAGTIREIGSTNPVLLDDEDGIIAEHGGVMAAIRLGRQQAGRAGGMGP